MSSPATVPRPDVDTHVFPAVKDNYDPLTKTAWLPSWLRVDLELWEWDVLVVSTAFKLLLLPSYRSTDFEVHRNWLAITHSLPLSRWYYDTTSEWTLDYPPLFAYFEKLLSIPASLIDPKIVDLKNLHYSAWSVVAYQRSTVIFTELVLGIAALRFIRGASDPAAQRIISASLFLHPGFVIVDHIHFQYNGFLFGMLLWSLLMARNGNKLASGVLFAILLCFKHIYIYLAPAYFIYLLRAFCISPKGELLVMNFLSLANAVITVLIVSFGPFILLGQMPQVLSRLFPFSRGLSHAYWAPNIWALVTTADRILLRCARMAGLDVMVNSAGVQSSTRGLVGDTVFAILPNVKPVHTFVLTIAFQTIFLARLWMKPTYRSFVTALTLCGFCSFMFGWHVHEKAILLVLVPLSLTAAESQAHLRTFMLASVSGVYSLFPLLFNPAETPIKVIYSLIWAVLVFASLHRRIYEHPKALTSTLVTKLETFYLAGFPLLQLFVTLFAIITQRRATDSELKDQSQAVASLDFLPLMLTSVYCAVGLVWAFLRLAVIYLRHG